MPAAAGEPDRRSPAGRCPGSVSTRPAAVSSRTMLETVAGASPVARASSAWVGASSASAVAQQRRAPGAGWPPAATPSTRAQRRGTRVGHGATLCSPVAVLSSRVERLGAARIAIWLILCSSLDHKECDGRHSFESHTLVAATAARAGGGFTVATPLTRVAAARRHDGSSPWALAACGANDAESGGDSGERGRHDHRPAAARDQDHPLRGLRPAAVRGRRSPSCATTARSSTTTPTRTRPSRPSRSTPPSTRAPP